MVFEGIDVQGGRLAQGLQRLEQAPGVDRERPDILVIGSVIQQQRPGQVVRVEEG